jgi:hypothetical protein
VQRSQARAPQSVVDVFWNFLDNRKVAARIARPFIRGVERIEGFLKANGVITRPLVPEKELFACQRHAIQILIGAVPTPRGAITSSLESFRATRCP